MPRWLRQRVVRPSPRSDSSTHDLTLHIGDAFCFIQVGEQDDAANRRETKRLARSHAVKKALEKKRQLQRKTGLNFRIVSAAEVSVRQSSKARGLPTSSSTESSTPPTPSSGYLTAASNLGPLEMLASHSSALQEWFAKSASKPLPYSLFCLHTDSD